jgi:mannose-1-phosphate guanylyltransferase
VVANNKSPMDRFHAVIPAGGTGSRLWPLSRADAPKFLHDLTGSGKTLLQDTFERLSGLAGKSRTMVVAGIGHRAAIINQLGELLPENLILEPSQKDSTAAIALAAAILMEREPDVIIGSFPADHVIKDIAGFEDSIRKAVSIAATGKIAVIGVEPTEPAVGFGYIKVGEDLGSVGVSDVSKFVEKPSLKKAKKYLSSGNYLWNAGIFIAPAKLLLDQLQKTEPELHSLVLEIARAIGTRQQDSVFEKLWPRLKKIAIDYSLAEPAAKAGLVAVVEAQFDWHDVGDFAAIAGWQAKGREGNLAVLGSAKVLAENSSGILVSDSKRLVAIIGMEDVIVVDTPDALLITNKQNAQKVKALVDSLKETGHDELL